MTIRFRAASLALAYGVPKQIVAVETKPWPMFVLPGATLPAMSPDPGLESDA